MSAHVFSSRIDQLLADGPFVFRYDGVSSRDLLPGWGRSADGSIWTDPATGLEVRCAAIVYPDFPAVEWVLYLRNTGTVDTPILADIQALDVAFPLAPAQAVRVHTANGSGCRLDDFAPCVYPLSADIAHPQLPAVREGNPVLLATSGGRSSNGAFPFFNLQMGEGGVMGAIGWTGDWAARFWRDDAGGVYARAGMARTHLILHPGEEIRSPRIALFFWDGDRDDAHNGFRRFILAHHTPRHDGVPQQAPISYAVWGENSTDRHLEKLHWFVEHEIPVENFWIDAGWHGDAPYAPTSNVFNSHWWAQVGNWWPNAATYPDGLAPIGAAARAAGMRFTLWLEPERIYKDTQFTREHPEWLLGPNGDNFLFDLGNPVARAALIAQVSRLIDDGGVTCYRQDFNTDPAPFWAAADAPDRIGMHEIRHIEGLYAYWDALRAAHPGLLIDNCSSGGRRLDLEMISRGIALWRSDYQCFPGYLGSGMQGQTQGLAPWIPVSAAAFDHQETYAARSAGSPGVTICTAVNPRDDSEGYLTPWEAFDPVWLRQRLTEMQRLRPYFLGDYYPLLRYTTADDAWAAWQFDRPDLGEGALFVFRRPHSPFAAMTPTLRALDPAATYALQNLDTDETWQLPGHALQNSLTLTITEAPGSVVIIYKRVAE